MSCRIRLGCSLESPLIIFEDALQLRPLPSRATLSFFLQNSSSNEISSQTLPRRAVHFFLSFFREQFQVLSDLSVPHLLPQVLDLTFQKRKFSCLDPQAISGAGSSIGSFCFSKFTNAKRVYTRHTTEISIQVPLMGFLQNKIKVLNLFKTQTK